MDTKSPLIKLAVVGAILAAMVLPSLVGYHYYGKVTVLKQSVKDLTDNLVHTQDTLEATLEGEQRANLALSELRKKKGLTDAELQSAKSELERIHLRNPGHNCPVLPAVADRLREANDQIRKSGSIRP